MTRFFRAAPLAASALVTTIVFLGALAYFAVRLAVPMINGGLADSFDLLTGIVLAVLVGFAWLRSVRGYSLAQNEIVVNRTGPGKLRIPMSDIEYVEVNPDLGAFIKANPLSLQGLFGWSGNVDVRKPSDTTSLQAQAYGTNPANMVVLRLTNGRTIILTPKDTAGFAEALQAAGVGGRAATVAGYKQGPRSKKKR